MCFAILVTILLHNQGPLVETADLQVKDVMTDLEIANCLLVSVEHHQTAANVIMQYRVVHRLYFKTAAEDSFSFTEAAQSILVFCKME